MLLEAKIGTKPKVLSYIRVSTTEQVNTGYSLEVQDRRLRDFAIQNGWQLLETFRDEGKSARTIGRPSFKALLDYCEQHSDIVDAILVQDTSRFCRDALDHLLVRKFLKDIDIKLIKLDGNNDETIESELLDLITAGVNQAESKRTGLKTKNIMLDMFERGLKPGQAPIGYLNSFKKDVPMYPDDGRKYFIQEAFNMWNSGNYSLGEISENLREKGFRTAGGKSIGKSVIQSILKRVDYAGGLKYDGQTNKNALHEPIITMEEFEKAQRMFEIRNKGADRSRKHVTLLAGIIHCFKCGKLMHGEYHEDGNYYRCGDCGNPYARMDYIDDEISTFFKGAAFTDKGLSKLKEVLLEVQSEQKDAKPSTKSSLEARRKAIDGKMSKIEDRLIFDSVGSIDKERVEQKYALLKEEMKQVENQLKEIDKPSSNLKSGEIEKIIWGMGRMGEIYQALNITQKKQFLKFFIKKVFVDCSENRIKDYELVEEFKTLLSGDLARISSNWLPRVDSNHEPAG